MAAQESPRPQTFSRFPAGVRDDLAAQRRAVSPPPLSGAAHFRRKIRLHSGWVVGLFSCVPPDWQSRRAASRGGFVTNSHCKLKACFAARRSAGFLIGAQTRRATSDVVCSLKHREKRSLSLPPSVFFYPLGWYLQFCVALKRVLADGDQRDKILINFHAGPLPRPRP